MTKHKNYKCDKTLNVTRLKNSKFDKTQKTQNMTKHKNSKYDQILKLEM